MDSLTHPFLHREGAKRSLHLFPDLPAKGGGQRLALLRTPRHEADPCDGRGIDPLIGAGV